MNFSQNNYNQNKEYTHPQRDFHVAIKGERGFTLLFASLIAALLLAIGLAVFNISNKELILSTSARDSQFAFYAADAGLECALFWDFQHGTFSPGGASDIVCAGVTIPNVGGAPYGVEKTFTFDLAPQPYCTTVSVTKFDSPRRTEIKARGYNTCDTSYSRRVERALRATY